MTCPKLLPSDEVRMKRVRKLAPAWIRKAIFTVTALKFARTSIVLHSRVWAWYPTKKLAFASGFIGDDESGYYDTWLVERITAGFPYCGMDSRWWFKKRDGKVVLVPEPPGVSHICNFSIG